MQKHFKANLDPPSSKINIGDSSLIGEYTCNYCGERCAQRSRFQVWQSTGPKGCFCTPECSLAFVSYRCPNIPPPEKEAMIAAIKQHAGRAYILSAPPPNRLFRFDPQRGLTREQWLPMTRRLLEGDELLVAQKELVVQKTL